MSLTDKTYRQRLEQYEQAKKRLPPMPPKKYQQEVKKLADTYKV